LLFRGRARTGISLQAAIDAYVFPVPKPHQMCNPLVHT
jgi:hypothetical protein